MDQTDILNGLRERDREWHALLDEIGIDRMDQPGVNGDWTMKDIVAHLTVWNRRLVSHLGAAVRHVPEPLPPWSPQLEAEDDINAWIYETNRGRSVREVLDESNQVHEQLVAVVAAIPNSFRFGLVEPKYLIVWVDDERIPICEFFDHFEDEHAADVHAWLARVKQQEAASHG